MAVRITTDGKVKVVHPEDSFFWENDLMSLTSEEHERFRLGPVWILASSTPKGGTVNQIASYFLEAKAYGDVLVVPDSQMPFTEESSFDSQIPPSHVDAGIILAIYKIIKDYRLSKEIPKNEYVYKPSGKVDDDVTAFYHKAYENVIKKDFKETGIMFETFDDVYIVESLSDMRKTVKEMIDLYVEAEEYEKCAALQRVLDSI
jgi:hypothetical protein